MRRVRDERVDNALASALLRAIKPVFVAPWPVPGEPPVLSGIPDDVLEVVARTDWSARGELARTGRVASCGLVCVVEPGRGGVPWIRCFDSSELVRLVLDLQGEIAQAQRLADEDDLTGLANRRAFRERLVREATADERYGSTFALVLVDLDRFKAINDLLGHLSGDRALVETAVALKAECRVGLDLPARLGGDEFAVLLPHTDEEGARAFAERLEARISRITIAGASLCIDLSASLGVAAHRPAESVDDLFARADADLYRHKSRHDAGDAQEDRLSARGCA